MYQYHKKMKIQNILNYEKFYLLGVGTRNNSLFFDTQIDTHWWKEKAFNIKIASELRTSYSILVDVQNYQNLTRKWPTETSHVLIPECDINDIELIRLARTIGNCMVLYCIGIRKMKMKKLYIGYYLYDEISELILTVPKK